MTLRWRTLARWTVAIVVIAALLTVLDLGEIGARLASVDLRLALPAIGGLVAVHLVAAASWRRLTAALAGVQLDWRTTVRAYYAAQAVGTITPANIGADVYRVTAVGGTGAVGRLVRAVVLQRVTSIAALVALGVAGTLLLPLPGLGPFVFVLGGLGAAAAVVIALLSTTPSFVPRMAGRLLRRLGLHEEGHEPSTRLRSALVDGFGLGLVFHMLSLLLGLFMVAAVDPVAAGLPAVVLGALAVARLSLAVPITPNGIGVQEGLLTVLFVQLGLPPETAIATSVLNRLAFLVTAAIGAASMATGSRTGQAPRPARVAARPSLSPPPGR